MKPKDIAGMVLLGLIFIGLFDLFMWSVSYGG